jgi:hypothetical protein
MSEKTELLPCPFCGSDAEEWEHRIDQGGDGCTAYNAGCKNRECLGMLSAAVCGPWGYRKKGDLPDNETARSNAVDKWNTRTLPPDVEAVIAAARKEIYLEVANTLHTAYGDNKVSQMYRRKALDSEGRQ